MAKYINNKIKSGRVAGSVFAVRYGEVIERAYNPYVSNPKTEAQTANRARMKLMTQLSAICAPVIAMPRIGAQSTRNQFVARNYGLSQYNNGQADITLEQVQLTKGVAAMPSIVGTRSEDTLNVQLGYSAQDIDRVVYACLVKQVDGKLRVATTAVSEDDINRFRVTLEPGTGAEAVVLAYGIRYNTEAARVAFGDLTVTTAEAIAKLIVTRVVLDSDITLTETVGVTIARS